MEVLVAILRKEHRLGFPKIGRDSRIDLRGLRCGARKVDCKCKCTLTGIIFVIFKRNLEIALPLVLRILGLTMHLTPWLSTRLQIMFLSGLAF